MTEDEYVLVGDLARVRAAQSIVDGMMKPAMYLRPVRVALAQIEAVLSEQVEIASPEDD